MSELTVVIADDHPLFRSALKQAIVECIDTDDIAEADSFNDLQQVISAHPSLELVFLDLHMPGNSGFSGLTQLRSHYPDLIVIMVSSDDNPDIMKRAIDFGATAFIPKSADISTISSAINSVLDGDVWLPEGTLELIETDEASEHKKLATQLAGLTPQQFTVLQLIADGKLNKQIGYMLNITENTVKKHVSAILSQLEVNNRTLAGLAYQQLRQVPAQN